MSLLSALLTQDQVVSPEKLDEAIQRQVISGGDFETSLLEVGAIAEDTLAAYCAAVYDLPLATRDEVLEADPVAIARLPRDAAERHQVAALRIEGSRLVVACARPLDADTLGALAEAGRLPVDPRVATPFRVAWALWRYYQVPLQARYARLAEKLHTRPPGPVPVVSRSPSGAPGRSDRWSSMRPQSTSSALAALARALEDDDDDEPEDPPTPVALPPPRVRVQTPARPARPPPAADVTPPGAPRAPLPGAPRAPLPGAPRAPLPEAPKATAPTDAATPPPGVLPPGTRPAPAGTSRPPPPMPALPVPAVTPGISLAEARRRLAEARTRDVVIAALLDHLATGFPYVALFVVHGDTAEGIASRGAGAGTEAVRGIAVPLEPPSALREARARGAAVSCRVEPDGTDAYVRDDLGLPGARDVLVAPVRIGGRVSLLVWADTGARPPSPAALRDLAAFLDTCGEAFTRLVRTRKQSTSPPPVTSMAPSVAPGLVTPIAPAATATPRASRAPSSVPAPGSGKKVPRPSRAQQLQALRQVIATASPSAAPPTEGASVGSPVASPTPSPRETPSPRPGKAPQSGSRGSTSPMGLVTESERLVSETLRTGILSDDAAGLLLGQGERALEVIFRYFPGPNTLDRTQVPTRVPTMSESGPLLRLAVTFRQAAVPRLLAALDGSSPEGRYAALLCLGEIVHPQALPRLAPRLLDPDYPTRMAAIEVLRNYRRFPEFADVGRTLRTTLADPAAPAERRRIVAHALGELRDAEAVPALITALGAADFALAGAAHRALVVLTRQDFGTDAPRWLAWWDRGRAQHRMEWLIDALLHPEPTIRHDASEELKRASGQFFGYYFNLPRRERERAHQRYADWWKREGASHFADRH